jgi:drug/metabolite transporter (DMT)-like permease
VWQTLRGLCTAGSSVLFVLGVSRMTMAQATTISFLSPLLVTVLSIPLLGEVVGVRRWAAVTAGILGMLIVVRPGLGGFQPAALFGVGSATCWAVALVLTRKLAAEDPPRTTVLWSAMTGAVVLSFALPFQAVWPAWWQLGLALAMGVVATGGQWLVVLAHRVAAASVLAPIFYAQLLWSALGGYLVFHNLPDEWTGLGAAVIIGSGLYTAHRERVRHGQGGSAQARAAQGAASQPTRTVAKSRVAV